VEGERGGRGVRLSITTIEAYRLWRDNEWMSLDDLEATIKRAAVPNEKMLRGIAFHSIIEKPHAYASQPFGDKQYRVPARDGSPDFIFDGAGIDRVLEQWPKLPAPEVKSTFEVEGITVVGIADALEGVTVWEAKAPEQIDVEKYVDSFQWRALLKLYNASVVRYVLAQVKDNGARFVSISNVLPLPFYRYPKLDDDVRRLASECADFVVKRNLEQYAQEREAA
jgi:hypothetical protein